jgi:hypothetical protein
MAGDAMGATLATSLALTPVTALGSILTSFLGLAILLFAARRDWLHDAASKREDGSRIITKASELVGTVWQL